MEGKRLIFALLVAVTVVLSLGHQVSARRLFKDGDFKMRSPQQSDKLWKEEGQPGSSYQSTEYQTLSEIDRLKLSISKLICSSMEEGCGHMDDAQDQPDTSDHWAESFANLNPHEYVKEY